MDKLFFYIMLFAGLLVGCIDKQANSELEEFRAQLKLEELNKQQIKRWLSECDSGNFRIINELISEDFKAYYAGNTFDREWLRGSIEAFPRSFSESIHMINELYADKDKVVAHMTVKVIHTGEFLNTPPTGKKVEYDAFTIYRLENGIIKEMWWDKNAVLELKVKLGIGIE